MRSPVAPLLLAALLPFASGCTTGSRERACDPVQQTGCASGRCVVDAAGAPACLEPVADAPEGSLCDAPDVCAAGLGCARVAGVARCLRFCATAGGSDECVAARADDPVPAEVRAEALCAVAIPDRSDLGLCVLPCRPGVGDCPDGTRCGVAEGIGLLTCVPAGTLGVGAPCGGTLDSCAGGLACAPMGPGRTCAPLVAGADDCPLDTEPTALPVRSGAAVCVPCQGLGPRPGGGVWGACLGSRPLEGEGACDAADATCGCAPFGRFAAPAGQVAELARRLAQSNAPVAWVDARREGDGWVWGDGTAVEAGAWAPGEPDSGDCGALGFEGLSAADCSVHHPFVCEALQD